MPGDDQRIRRVTARLLELPRKSWEQGVALQALLELGDWDAVASLADEAVRRQAADGRLAVVAEHDASATDPAANGEAVWRVAERAADPKFHAAAGRMLAFLETRARRDADGVIYHLLDAPEIWIDSAYMAPPFLSLMGRIDDALAQIEGYRRRLWNERARLFSHQWDDARRELKRAAHWGVGNGWAAAGLVRVLGTLPPERGADRERLSGYLRELVDGCLAHLRPDGAFHDVVDDSSTFVEVNLSQMLAYAVYRGARAGWLEPRLLDVAERLRAAAIAKVDADGWVRDVCGAPTFDHPGTAAEGQAFHLLMEAARRSL